MLRLALFSLLHVHSASLASYMSLPSCHLRSSPSDRIFRRQAGNKGTPYQIDEQTERFNVKPNTTTKGPSLSKIRGDPMQLTGV